jgi:inorganic pyrophosphatase
LILALLGHNTYSEGIHVKTTHTLFLALALLFVSTAPLLAAEPAGQMELLAPGLSFKDPQTVAGRNFNDVAPRNQDGTVNAIIEIPAGTNAKWEVDPKTGVLAWEMQNGKPRVVEYLGYPGNYGTLAQTVSGDKDPLDILVIGAPLLRGSVVPAKVIGALRLLDKGEQDDKLIAVLPESHFGSVATLAQLDVKFPGTTAIIEAWFMNYKGAGKMKSQGFVEAAAALQILDSAIAAYK